MHRYSAHANLLQHTTENEYVQYVPSNNQLYDVLKCELRPCMMRYVYNEFNRNIQIAIDERNFCQV